MFFSNALFLVSLSKAKEHPQFHGYFIFSSCFFEKLLPLCLLAKNGYKGAASQISFNFEYSKNLFSCLGLCMFTLDGRRLFPSFFVLFLIVTQTCRNSASTLQGFLFSTL